MVVAWKMEIVKSAAVYRGMYLCTSKEFWPLMVEALIRVELNDRILASNECLRRHLSPEKETMSTDFLTKLSKFMLKDTQRFEENVILFLFFVYLSFRYSRSILKGGGILVDPKDSRSEPSSYYGPVSVILCVLY